MSRIIKLSRKEKKYEEEIISRCFDIEYDSDSNILLYHMSHNREKFTIKVAKKGHFNKSYRITMVYIATNFSKL